jgi:hypothetical protein
MSKTRVHSTKSSIEATGIQRQLLDQGINAMVIDKMDSAYGSVIGDIEIFVEEDQVESAQNLIKNYFKD